MSLLRFIAFAFGVLFCAIGLPLMAFAIGIKFSAKDSFSDICRKLAA